jgi:1A family penicillin-binding protein
MTRHGQHEKRPKRKSRLLKWFKWTLIAGAIFVLTCFIFFFSYLMGLEEWKEFDPTKIGEMQQTLLIYDANGVETAALHGLENRVYVTIDHIPNYVKNAFLAVEDARFYEHSGVDFIRIAGAFLEDLKRGSLSQGASTISQQLVKLTCLTGVKTISRKLQEAVMAFELEQACTKDEILEMYLNYVYFGNGAYGIEAAAKVYFGKTTQTLTISQAALLAGVIKSATNYAPHLHLDRSIKRRDLVLSLMASQGFITEAQEVQAKAEDVTLVPDADTKYDYFTDMVLCEAEDVLHMGTEELLASGYRIYTTLDTELQNKVEALFENSAGFPDNAADGEKCQAALVILDSETSEVRAVMGGRQYETRRGLNRVVDMKRQPGSTIKPVLVYAPAMEKLGYTPATLVLDEKGDFDGYVPKNFSDSYEGWVTLRRALASSLNLPAVRTLSAVGVDTAKLYAARVGIPFEKADTGLPLALGGFTKGVTPLSLCNAFTPFANGGYYSYPSCIARITDARGKTVYERPQTKTGVLSEDTAYLMTSMLQSAVQEGTARRVRLDGVTLAAKTGTSGADNISGNKDAWTVAYNADYTVCCWMGFDSTDEAHCLPSDATGGTYPALLVKQVFEYMYISRSAPAFVQPDGVVQAKIDLKSLFVEDEPRLASAFTPEDQTLEEYFPEDGAPTIYSTYWTVPKPPDDLSVSSGAGGYPLISFTPLESYVIYRLMRADIATGQTVKIGEFTGSRDQVSLRDDTALYGHTYQYYVLPVHPEIEVDGAPLTGAPSPEKEIALLREEDYMP